MENDIVVVNSGFFERDFAEGNDVLKLRIGGDPTVRRIVLADGGDGVDTVDIGYTSNAFGYELFRETIDLSGVETSSHRGDQTIVTNFENVIGSAASDRVIGNSDANELLGFGGNDVIEGGGGDDTISGHNGDDELLGGAGDDVIHLGVGDNFANGGTGHDEIIAYNGSDSILGGFGDDVISSGAYETLAPFRTAAPVATTAHEGERPVVFIVLDDAWSIMSFMDPDASRFASLTENLNALATSGTAFVNAYATSTLCAPSRASFLSSTMPSDNGVTGGLTDRGATDSLMLPQYFNQQGFTSGSIGKVFNHTEDHVDGLDFFQFERTQVNLGKALRDGPIGYAEEVIVEDGSFVWTKTIERQPGLSDAEWAAIAKDLWADIETAEDAALKLEEFGQTEENFFLAVGFQFPHTPYHLPKEYLDFMDENFSDDDYRDLAEGLGFQLGVRGESEWLLTVGQRIIDILSLPNRPFVDTEAEAIEVLKYYLASIKFADDQIGKVIDAARAQTPDAVIVATSDHGYHMGDHERYDKASLWPMATQVPLIISDPEVAGGAKVDAVVSLLDVYPTLADLAGVDIPQHVQGRSLYEHVKAGETTPDWDGVAIVEISDNFALKDMTGYAVAKGDYYYIRYVDNSEELYNLSTDPRAYDNLLFTNPTAYSDIAEALSGYIPRGNDSVRAGSGDDLITAGAGDDELYGQDGNDEIFGFGGDDNLFGGFGVDEIFGGNGNDFMDGGPGSDFLNGGDGFDTVDRMADAFDPTGYTVGAGGTVSLNGVGDDVDTLTNIETVAFSNGELRFDAGYFENFGAAYRFYTSILDRQPDGAGLDFYVSLLDRGVSIFAIAEDIASSDEFEARFGSDLSTVNFLGRVYANILNREPDAPGLAFWRDAIDTNEVTRFEATVYISEDTENLESTFDLIGSGYFVEDFGF